MALSTATEVGDSSDLSMVTVTQGRHLILSFFPVFVAKTAPGFNPFSRAFHIRSFASMWPRRMWNVSFGSVGSDLFPPAHVFPWSAWDSLVSVQDPDRPMSNLWNTVQTAHRYVCLMFEVQAHAFRDSATSLLLWKNCSVASRLEAGC